MLGIFYIFICIFTGFMFCKIFFPRLIERAYVERENGSMIKLPAYYVLLPAWYITGTLVVTWLVYIVSYASKSAPKPLIYGNVIVLGMLAAAFTMFYGVGFNTKKIRNINLKMLGEFFWNGDPSYAVYAGIALAFCIIIMYKTFYVAGSNMNVGLSVWADFGAHLSMIRSFSYGNNFPTQYAYCGDADIRYHFMHEFLVGNLEFLGLRIDHAFNLPSIMNLFCTYLLLFTLTVNIFKCRLTAWIGGLLFTFRSSFSVFDFLAKDRSGHPIQALLNNTSYFTLSDYHEGWGFWCTRVFCNQRHFAFGITALLLAILIFLPYLKEMGENLDVLKKEGVVVKEKRKRDEDEGEDGEEYEEMINISYEPEWWDYVKLCFFSKDSFALKSPATAIGAGLFMGALAFWHGSALIATLAMLFFMAAFSVCRMDYLIAAIMAVVMAVAQSKFFIFGNAVSPKYEFGFIAENRTVFGVIAYIFLLTGITLVIATFGMILVRGTARYMFLVSLVPFALSFFLSLTPDIAVNHKWVIISLMLVSMYTAHFVSNLFRQPGMISAFVAAILTFCLTATGITELYIQSREDRNYLTFSMNDEVTLWLKENLDSDDLVLDGTYALNNIVLGGIIHYYSYPYCTWSAGYETAPRAAMIDRIFSATDSKELDYYIYKSNIDYIIVSKALREEYNVNEELLTATYKEVYTYDEGDWSIRIFDTNQRLY
jgi:hypothetical protein